VETTEAGHSPLFTCNMNSGEWIKLLITVYFAEQWRVSPDKEKREGKEQRDGNGLKNSKNSVGLWWKIAALHWWTVSFFPLFLFFSFSLSGHASPCDTCRETINPTHWVSSHVIVLCVAKSIDLHIAATYSLFAGTGQLKPPNWTRW
jgi:hypothetical protein